MKVITIILCVAATGVVLGVIYPHYQPIDDDQCKRESMRVAYIHLAIDDFRRSTGHNPDGRTSWDALMKHGSDVKLDKARFAEPIASHDAWGYEYRYEQLADGVFLVTSQGIEMNCQATYQRRK